ncbi:benzoylformate decarboxylase [Burkholderia pseudomallei]|uniref:benzoylformate decarboxylase n=1 Tax=Burkholderia pseudomallei TaxID=28450 RepID=UPI00025C2A77|nr:benzoylformate decarboxylase [Burkholderia pseudomallei]EIF62946.1 benzoylformate decarboxylase [Burkholderia pseudomallei 1258a]AHE33921.1 benzoylformate decarboxylase [Burkholderia pseudomallei NAU20B-16]AHG34375.1 benzoylformate decarboxylase [Burkholderia pseudomallei MSHR511]AHG67176.1 benzoylformate decarboxylase [Burkholderia pseudomallei MSHR146]AIP03182.1 benzoylformate decarboxylase [Burkholderia pseudomallei]
MTPPDLRADAPARAPYTVRDAVIDLLRRFGIRKVFGNPGSTELPMFRNFPDDFEYVLGLHEAVAVGMADGYAQASGNAAVVNLHSAAGVGNAMGVLFTAYRNKTPLVVTAGQQARSILPFEPFLASVQAAELPKPYVKWSIEPARAEDVPAAIARAYHVAMQEPRGPVFVSIPADDWDRPAEPMPARTVSSEVRPAPEALARLGDALDASERPAFVVGAAVARAGAWDDAVRLAERHRARVYAAPMSGRCSFPEDHPLFAGFLPPIRERIVEQLAGHDFILAFGAPVFTYHIEGFGPHVPAGATLHQLVDDPSVAAWTPVGDAVVGNLRLAARDLLARAAPRERPMPAPRAPRGRVGPGAPGERMPVAFALQTLADVRGSRDVVVEEAPSARPAMHEHLPFSSADTFYTMDSGGLGYGMPAALGIALGSPGRRVIALIGDGSSLYSIQALWSAVHLKLPVTFVILNNARYAALQDFAPVFGFRDGEPVQGTALPGLDFVSLARGFGCDGVRVSDAARLRDALERALASPVPVVVDVDVA